jgi:serine/threonine-protein kinase
MSDRSLTHQTLGRYQLLVAVARGGMGQVWLGRLKGARGFNKLVAVKTLLPSESDRSRLEAMLAEEARIASLVQHANVVHTMELGEHDGLLYLVMEWVDGEPLGFLMSRAEERGGMPRGVAVQLVSQVLSGLHAAHELSDDNGPLGVVHRDVSPHNILVTYDGVAKVLDFGIAKATHQASSGNTETGEIKGKFSYMAPEQILGGDVDRRADVFAAGIVLYLLATGKHPFKHHNTAAVIHAITTDDPVAPPSTLVDDFPPELERVMLKALDKDVENRWESAEAMRAALEQAMPEAFTDAGRSELRAFMEHAVGDRKVARREAVRKAQLAADSRDIETGTRQALQSSPGQSASSLRAISISNPAPEDVPELVVAQTGEFTPAAPKAKRPSKGAYLAAFAGIALALGVFSTRLLTPAGSSRSSATSSGPEAGAPLLAPEAKPTPKPTALPAAVPAPNDAPAPAEAAALPAPAAPAKPAPAANVAAVPRAKGAAASAPAKPQKRAPSKTHEKSAASSDTSDLLTPDYAR